MAYLFRHRKLLPRRNVEKIPSTYIRPTWECARSLGHGSIGPGQSAGEPEGESIVALYQSALLTEARTSSMLCSRLSGSNKSKKVAACRLGITSVCNPVTGYLPRIANASALDVMTRSAGSSQVAATTPRGVRLCSDVELLDRTRQTSSTRPRARHLDPRAQASAPS
jgi:hypothetical protein